MVENLIIIGSGPAGYTAAIYAARANLAPILFEGAEPGGQLMTTTDVENYPGYPQGILGPEMMVDFKTQAERFGTKIFSKEVTRVDFSARPFKIWTDDELHESKAIIISTGASAKRLGLELDKKGYVVTRPGSTLTSVEGVFAGGDCVDHKYRQAVTAAGLGCQAAMDAEKWLEAQGA